MNISLVLSEGTHETLKDHLHSGNQLEAAAIMLCALGKGAQSTRLIVREAILIPPPEYDKQTPIYVSWPFSKYMIPQKIDQIDKEKLSIFTIHSHPKGYNDFSITDDENDRALFHSISGWFDDNRLNGSAIMLPDGSIIARTYTEGGEFAPIKRVSVVGENITIWKQTKSEDEIPNYATRISQTFGKGTFGLLRSLKVGVVGCSGTGSIIVELLARNCIGSLVLIDPDVVEEKNLNRIMNTKKSDAEKGVPKVEILKQAIEKMGMNVNVETYKSDTYDKEPIEALVDCDIIFGCVDSAAGRYHLECVSKAYFIPYFDVGVYLESDGKGGISQANAVSRYIHPDSCSLLNRGVYTSEQVTAERLKRDNVEHYEKQIQEGYVKGVVEDQPAVMSVNMQAACLAFNDFLARLHSFRLDDNSKFGTQTFQLVQGCYLSEEDEGDDGSIFKKYLGKGEGSLLIQNLKRRKKS